MATDAPKGSSDFLRLYVIVMGLLAAVLGYFLWRLTGERQEYETANSQARAIFGGPDAAATPADQRPTTVRGLAVGVQKYLATYKAATVKTSDNGPPIPMTLIADRAGGMGLVVQNRNDQPPSRNQAKRYEELSTMITFEPTDLERLAKFLYNLEASSTQIRVLDVRWELRPEKENPPVPGYLITRPQVKIGFRRPIAGRT